MADYVIGDVQGCYDPLQRLLDKIDFNENCDRLWFVGDLVNRGPASLAVLRFIMQLPLTPRVTLGNHDLHLMALLFAETSKPQTDDTLQDILKAADSEVLGHWLRQQAILYYDEALNVVMSHAGIAPIWDLAKARQCAQELEAVLVGPDFKTFLNHMYSNQDNLWSDDLVGLTRLRVICNYFTRMRCCDAEGRLALGYKDTLANIPEGLYPWYVVPHRIAIPTDIVFGHWAALNGHCSQPACYALDTGCYRGGFLTALRLQDKRRFAVPGTKI